MATNLKSKVIELTINENYLGSAISNQGFEKLKMSGMMITIACLQ
jgi:hypothetical protein